MLCLICGQISPYMLELHNRERVKYGAVPLKLDLELNKAAQKHADWMASRGQMVHQNLGNFMKGYSTAGENIAMGQRNEEDVVRAWLNSPGHRRNILNKNFTHFGFGLASRGGTLYWCAVFTGR
jgi:uncharacterized protein YkwD